MNKIITIQADKERHLKLGINGLIELEKVLGKPISELDESIGILEIRSIMYVAMKWEDKKMTLEKAGEVMDAYLETNGFEGIGKIVGDLVQSALGTKLPSS